MLDRRHIRFCSLQKLQSVALLDNGDPPISEPVSDQEDEKPLYMIPLWEDTPKMITCAMQPLASILSDAEQLSPVATEGAFSPQSISFDEFLSDTRSKVFNLTIRKVPIKRRIMGRPKETIDPRGMLLREAQEKATFREVEIAKRRIAVFKIQHWYRTIRKRRILREEESRLRDTQTTDLRRKIAIRRIIRAIREFGNRRKLAKMELSQKFRSLCVGLIQKVWRGFRARKAYRNAINARYEKASAALTGWKVRKILRISLMQDIKAEIQTNTDPVFIKSLKRDFGHQFIVLWINGAWVRCVKNSLHTKYLRRNQQRSLIFPQKRADPQTQRSRSPQSGRLGGVRRLPPSACKTEGSVASTEESCSSPSPVRPFLRRKSSRVSLQRVNWGQVRSRVQCWSSRPEDPGDTSLEEFLSFERSASKKEPGLNSLEIVLRPCGEAGKEEDQRTKIWEKPSHKGLEIRPESEELETMKVCSIPRLREDSMFLVSLQRIEHIQVFQEIRELLAKEFEVLQ